ncbi:hypothetical protein ACEUZ9_000944 [Paracoccus litorisediminis]|uniref:hypothetical protein n=1 Tax=Paracoccus litorisediminis TaxID=2006130 RepID=UPI003731BCE7
MTWGQVIDEHLVRSGNPRSSLFVSFNDLFIGFDEEDKLCVCCQGQGSFSVRIPIALQRATEEEIEDRGIAIFPASSRQCRTVRGDEGQLLNPDTCTPEAFHAALSALTGVHPEATRRGAALWAGETVANYNLPGGRPFLYEEIGNTALFAFVAIDGPKARYHIGHVAGSGQNKFLNIDSSASGTIRHHGLGGMLRHMQAAFEKRVDIWKEMDARRAPKDSETEERPGL